MNEKTTSHAVDISIFCAKNDPREFLRQPIVHNGYVYASDGRIAMRQTTEAADSSPETLAKIPRLLELFELPTFDESWQCLAIPAPKNLVCPDCDGTGAVRTCESCDGDGEFEYYDKYYNCNKCDQNGFVSAEKESPRARDCKKCRGSGQLQKFNAVPVSDNKGIGPGPLAMLAQLDGDIHYKPLNNCTHIAIRYTTPAGALMEGVVMAYSM